MLIDTHAHLNFNAYKDDVDEVIKRTLANDVWMINVGSQYSTSKRAVEIAEKYPKGIYASVGLHPIHAAESQRRLLDENEDSHRLGDGSKNGHSFLPSLLGSKSSVFDYDKFKALAGLPKVVAIGEIGLDYKAEYSSFKEKQKEVFLEQLALAKELDLPVIFHCRMAHQDLLGIVNPEIKGVVHCFTGNIEQARKYLEMGMYLGFNGIIFKLDLDKVIKKTPLERILVETDCPYLTPSQAEGRNEPVYVKYVAEKIAEIKNISYEKISKITTENAKKLFNL